MSSRVRIQAPARKRRSNAERRAETRRRVLDAVVESIAEVGYQKTTTTEIARRAGVSWGAVQHHFGDKDGILIAALERSFDRFAQRIAEVPASDSSLTSRVSLFVDRSWQHFCSPEYRSTFEILLNLPEGFELSWQREVIEEWSGLWSHYFPESASHATAATLCLMRYSISTLSGLATTGMIEGRRDGRPTEELRFLKDTLVREFKTGDIER